MGKEGMKDGEWTGDVRSPILHESFCEWLEECGLSPRVLDPLLGEVSWRLARVEWRWRIRCGLPPGWWLSRWEEEGGSVWKARIEQEPAALPAVASLLH